MTVTKPNSFWVQWDLKWSFHWRGLSSASPSVLCPQLTRKNWQGVEKQKEVLEDQTEHYILSSHFKGSHNHLLYKVAGHPYLKWATEYITVLKTKIKAALHQKTELSVLPSLLKWKSFVSPCHSHYLGTEQLKCCNELESWDTTIQQSNITEAYKHTAWILKSFKEGCLCNITKWDDTYVTKVKYTVWSVGVTTSISSTFHCVYQAP